MAKLILDKNLATEAEIAVESFFEGGGRFSANGVNPTSVVGQFVAGKTITTYEAEFNDGTVYPIYGTYDYVLASINGSEGNPPHISFSITLSKVPTETE